MSKRIDLTRWNRASLNRFRYIDGNAVSFLELIRQDLVERYKDPATNQCAWIMPGVKTPKNEKLSEAATLVERQQVFNTKQERIVASYKQDRRDWLWEMSRTFARACHVLTEHADVYANEGYLGTATQWDNVRRLVEMLDYHPAPPASAYTPLVFIAKNAERVIKESQLIIEKGFQVKYTPPNGGEKIVFETLSDLLLNPALNSLRAKDWNKSQAPNIDKGTEAALTHVYSYLAKQEVIHIQGLGPNYASEIANKLMPKPFLIKDFIDFDPESSVLSMSKSQLWEWKAKAEVISFFQPKGDWSKVYEMFLQDIMEHTIDFLIELTGNSEEDTEQFKLDLEILKICLDNPFFQTLKLKQVILPMQLTPGDVRTFWKAPKKPKLKIDSVGMVCLTELVQSDGPTIKQAQAVWVSNVEEETQQIHLTPSLSQNTWYDWKQGESFLKVAPGWRRKPWLNGENVIRTVEPHGIVKGDYIGWIVGSDWQYVQVIKTDTRSLYVEFDGELPQKDTRLYRFLQSESDKFAATHEAVALLVENDEDIKPEVEQVNPSLPEPLQFSVGGGDPIFTIAPIDTSGSGGGLLPPASLPGIGSFLFPTPFLPVDLVKAAVELMLSIGVMQIPSTGEIVIKGLPPEGLDASLEEGFENYIASELPANYNLEDPLKKTAATLAFFLDQLVHEDNALVVWTDPTNKITDMEAVIESLVKDKPMTAMFNQVTNDMEPETIGPLLLHELPLSVIEKYPELSNHIAVVDSSQPQLLFNGKPDKIDPGDWIVAEYEEDVRALNIAAIDATNDEYFAVEFDNYSTESGSLLAINAAFVDADLAELASFNSEPLGTGDIELEDNVEDILKVGDEVLLTGEGKDSVLVKLDKVDGHFISTNPKAPSFKKGELIIRGNLALAGHGETKPSKILGSGNATLSNQEFVLKVSHVSFIPDATMSAGVAAAVEVSVSGEIWQQVATLKDSLEEDHHFETRMTEEGFVKIIFGDGVNGRRLPTGKNNIRVAYRVGTGSEGILPANVLNKMVKPNALVEKIHQPEPAGGGGDMEALESLKTNAPATLLALERAVSLSDFSHLAASQSSIWQASAEQVINSGRNECVLVNLVPVNGVMTPAIESQITRYLQSHALPNVVVKVSAFQSVMFDLDITIRVNSSAFDFDDVTANVVAKVTEATSLKNRKLGENFYLSEVFNLVEGIEGVENSVCLLNGIAGKQVVEANGLDSVVYLNSAGLVVSAEEYIR